MFSLLSAAVLTAAGLIPSSSDEGHDWPQFRGPGATGTSSEEGLPEHWGPSNNVAWTRELPGMGWSSPIVWGDRVFVTTVAGVQVKAPRKGLYSGSAATAARELDWIVMCCELGSGETLWKQMVRSGAPSFPVHQKNTYASETPVTDGERVYVQFGGVGVFAFDLDGKRRWTKPLKPMPMRGDWGTAASPVVHDGVLYVINDNEEASWIEALDAETGEVIWHRDRDEKSNWSTPYVWQHEKGAEIVTAGTGKVRSYSLDGELKWWLQGMSSITIASPFVHEGLLFITSGFVLDRRKPIYAIRPGGVGDLGVDAAAKSEFVAWSLPRAAPYNPSTIAYDGRLYSLLDSGILSCLDAASGEVKYDRQRVTAGAGVTSSPWAYGGKLFVLDEDGTTSVIKAGDEYELLHSNELGEMCMASPAISRGNLLIRTLSRLYCIRTED